MIVKFDVDYAYSLCGRDGRDCVYWQVAPKTGTRRYYVTVVVDSETGHFVDTMIEDDGPYDSDAEADRAGLSAALEWMVENDVRYSEKDARDHQKRISSTRSPARRRWR